MTSEYGDVFEHPTGRSLRLGHLLIPLTSVRTDNAPAGELNAYESGATVILQISSSTPGTWRSVTLS